MPLDEEVHVPTRRVSQTPPWPRVSAQPVRTPEEHKPVLPTQTLDLEPEDAGFETGRLGWWTFGLGWVSFRRQTLLGRGGTMNQ